MSALSGSKTYSYRYTGVDATTGQDISFPCPVNGFLIYVEDGAEATFTGTDDNSIAGVIASPFSWPVGGPTGRVFGNVKAAAGTVNLSVFAWR